MPSAAPTAATVRVSLTAAAANLKGPTDYCMDKDCSWAGSINICECSCNGVDACSTVGYGMGRYIGPNACNGENACNSIATQLLYFCQVCVSS